MGFELRKQLLTFFPLKILYKLKKTSCKMVKYVMSYDHLCVGPARAGGPARATVEIRKLEKRKENIWIQALKTKPIRTALKSLKKQKDSTSESTQRCQQRAERSLWPKS